MSKNIMKRTITFHMTPKMYEEVSHVAWLLKISRSEYIRNLILQDLKEHGKMREPGSLGDTE